MKNKTLWITQTAIFIALLVVIHYMTAMLANPLITGSAVNMTLIVSVMLCGLPSGLAVAAVSPAIARLIGIGPFWSLIPFIMAGNMTLVCIWHFVFKKAPAGKKANYVIALISAAILKFLVLYVGIVKIAVPLFLRLPENQANVISGMFSFSQIITASIGGVLAIAILPALKKALGKYWIY